MNRYICLLIISSQLAASNLQAQKGMPAKEIVTASITTHFPQHVAFKEEMVNQLKLPAGFKAEVAATGLGKPRMMATTEDGSVYVTRRDQGDVLFLKDTDNDGRFDEMKTVIVKFPGVHGIAIHNKFLYLCNNRELKRGSIKEDGTIENVKPLLNDLPDGGQHGNRTIAFGPDGMLYITVGSTCNDCFDSNPQNATILRANADGTGRKIYARGLRNTIGIDWHPQTKDLWGADNGADYKGDDWPKEELNKIIEEGDYGWPVVYEDRKVDQTREDPPGTTKEEYAKHTQPAVMTFPAHGAPINLIFLSKTTFPEEYKDDALVTLHGSWNRKEPKGYMIKRVRFENGTPVAVEDFLSGFLSKDGNSRFGRPAGLAISPKGEVYLSDDVNGVIYRITTSK